MRTRTTHSWTFFMHLLDTNLAVATISASTPAFRISLIYTLVPIRYLIVSVVYSTRLCLLSNPPSLFPLLDFRSILTLLETSQFDLHTLFPVV